MTKATAFVVVAIELSVVFQAIRQIIFSLSHKELFLGVTGTLGLGIAEGDFFAYERAIAIEKAFYQKITGVLWYRHL